MASNLWERMFKPIVAAQVWCIREFLGKPGRRQIDTADQHHHIQCIHRGRLNVNSCPRILLACQAEFGHQSKRSRSCTRQGELVCVHVFSVPVCCQSARHLTQCFVAIILEATDAPRNTSPAIGDALKFVHVSEERPCGPA